jgi:hypothetical protein
MGGILRQISVSFLFDGSNLKDAIKSFWQAPAILIKNAVEA